MVTTGFDCGWKGYSRAVGVRGTFGICHCGWRSPVGTVVQNKADVAEHIKSLFDAERQAIQDEYDEAYNDEGCTPGGWARSPT